MSDDNDYTDYQSGPFCRHWGDPNDCDIVCAECGHRCTQHACDDGDFSCSVDDCECQAWKEPEE